MSKFIACLYANPIIPRNAVQIVVDGIEMVLLEGVAPCVKNSADKLLSEGNILVEGFESILKVVDDIKGVLLNFKTEYKLNKLNILLSWELSLNHKK